MEEEARRNLQARRFNEHVKLLMTTVNAIAVVIFGAGILQPLVAAGIAGGGPPTDWAWVGLSAALHVFAQGLIRMLERSETMNQLPLWPPLAALAFAAIGYLVMWTWSKRLDREEEEARRSSRPPAK